jgi:hypothetical protein
MDNESPNFKMINSKGSNTNVSKLFVMDFWKYHHNTPKGCTHINPNSFSHVVLPQCFEKHDETTGCIYDWDGEEWCVFTHLTNKCVIDRITIDKFIEMMTFYMD